jgi:GST-like protein
LTVTYTLYGTRGSGSAAIEIALAACKQPFERITASSWEPESAQRELSRLNPLRQIPTLRLPDGSVLTESAAILIHLGLEFPNSGLLPRAAAARAQAIRGLVFIAANCYSAISISDYPERWTTATTGPARDKVRQGARRQLHRHWDLFADTFKTTPYLTGKAPGALDFLAAVVSRWSGTRPHLAKARPRFAATLRRIEAHGLVRPVFAAHWPAP